MTVASSTSKSGPYAGNGATTVFAFNFKVQAASDIKVLRTVSTGGSPVDTVLTSGADYTVSVNADQSASPGGSITMVVAPATGQQTTVLRNVTATQGTSIPNQGGFYPKVVENALDKLTMLVQQLYEEVTRSLKLSVTDTVTNLQDLLARINTAVTNAESSAGAASSSASDASGSASASSESATLASQWAATIGGQVAATDYSAKEYAIGTTVPVGSAKDWATKTSAAVTGALYSAKEWATGVLTRGAPSGGSAKDWATYTGGTVDDTEYSAKHYAAVAEAAAASIASGPVTSVNGMTGVVTGLASLGGNTFTGAQNELKGPDIASAATTMDIWAVAQGNVMMVTGTTATSGLPAAPQAGASRKLIAGGAWPLTHGADFLLPGGANYTCAAGDIVEVIAMTTTQFRLKITKANGAAVVTAGVGDHAVTVHTGNGFGSTNTMIRRFATTLTSTGTAITYADSPTAGASFTINEAGIYAIQYMDVPASGAGTIGVSLNSSQLTTSISSINVGTRISQLNLGGGAVSLMSVPVVVRCSANDVIRAHTDGTQTNTTDKVYFSIRKVGT